MLLALTPSASFHGPIATAAHETDIVETRLWLEEHDWLYALLRRSDNTAPTFRMPDLLSACVAQVFAQSRPAERIFGFMGIELVLRSPTTLRRRECLWRAQFDLLHDLQCSPRNRHPHPKFQLDQLTTACVALCQQEDDTGAAVLRQARRNMVDRLQAAQRAADAAEARV
ncbi:hypothetical protein [Pseudorhodoferax sp. Leaf267]|uniref:hypothetical protein n=1 Tax=Pseudorhodoferax sp. Leaf267 TaxID=1736316 RepID=UPI0006F1F919|nr:hypothetical protein [Pseudorhodoferax sp. Leaf267]KQP23378.1 hypothetical protein ASF43_05845 [Pseudorhodoferax sp. Leaf267]